MKTFDQNAIIEIAKQLLAANLKEGSYVVNVYEIFDGRNILKFKYNSFLEYVAKVNDDCGSLNTFNDFYFEWTDEE
jgi:hypothetical protein